MFPFLGASAVGATMLTGIIMSISESKAEDNHQRNLQDLENTRAEQARLAQDLDVLSREGVALVSRAMNRSFALTGGGKSERGAS